jgi:hypothetical protein
MIVSKTLDRERDVELCRLNLLLPSIYGDKLALGDGAETSVASPDAISPVVTDIFVSIIILATNVSL